jgi:SAM-dependent methyltransferase
VIASERARFLADYEYIRTAEGRGSASSAYYQALPYADLTRRNSDQWRIRARSFDYFASHILPRSPCDILDLGAGNCWLSYRLRERQHRPVAVDIFTDSRDGLGAAIHYPVQFPKIEAEFDRLPFANAAFDFAIFASSIHYSTDYVRTLAEARRCLRPSGRVVILDSPVYRCREHGERMRTERHATFERQFGFRSDALPSIEFFDRQMLTDLSRELALSWKIYRPWYGWRWHLRPLKARIKRQRPPSSFWILVGTFNQR